MRAPTSISLFGKEYLVEVVESFDKTPLDQPRLRISQKKETTELQITTPDAPPFFASLSHSPPESYYAYHRGFGGYTIDVQVPASLFWSAQEKEQIEFDAIKTHYQLPFSPSFLKEWERSGRFLFPEGHPVFEGITTFLDQGDKTFGQWSQTLLPHVEEMLDKGVDPMTELQEKGWPPPKGWNECAAKEEKMELLQEQLFELTPTLPELKEVEIDPNVWASAYLRMMHITYSELLKGLPSLTNETRSLEAPLTLRFEKTEELSDHPAIGVELDGGVTFLPFDASTYEMPWPTPNGHYLLKFQPHQIEIPYHIRLRQARKYLWPDSTQPASYEADVIITERSTSTQTPFTLKMNQVYESKEGWRFYLSSMSGDPGSLKLITLVVNYDPFRYFLTYPGALFVSIGTLLLFLKRRKKCSY